MVESLRLSMTHDSSHGSLVPRPNSLVHAHSFSHPRVKLNLLSDA